MIRTHRLLSSVAFALSSLVIVVGPASANAVSDFFTGTPPVVMQLMPGADGNKAMNFLFNATQDDGTWLGVPLRDLPTAGHCRGSSRYKSPAATPFSETAGKQVSVDAAVEPI